MSDSTTNPLTYYASFGMITDPGRQRDLLAELPATIPDLCRVVQGCMIHIFHAQRYGFDPSDERKQEVQLRHLPRMLARMRELDAHPLAVARPPERRLIGNCHDYSTLLCTLLRSQGIPARARCGFGAYFEPGKYVDHWVCEYWSADERRWVLVDAQLDEVQCQAFQIPFDPCDVPRDQFFVAGRAWQLCRQGEANPERFGIFDMWGLWFIRGNLVRDFAALNKVELLPWDCWGLALTDDADLTDADLLLLDRAATLSQAEGEAFSELRALYQEDARLRVPPTIQSFLGPAEVRTIDLTTGAAR